MMFDFLYDSDKQHLMDLIEWLYAESLSAGGDGDALWYSGQYNVKDILPLVEEVNARHGNKWKVDKIGEVGILWHGPPEESVEITNDESYFNAAPSWYQVKVRY